MKILSSSYTTTLSPPALALTLQQAKGSHHKLSPLNQKLTSTPGLFICGLCRIYADASQLRSI